ncbi:MAG: hypothetical protein AAF992_25615 [Bacteroidota bacterium]
MNSLSRNQIDQIAADLESQGITFEPLKSELLDHLICDVELEMENGSDFIHAWLSVKNKIPHNHFNHLQTETMELLSKKINPVRIFGLISIALLAFATLFKTLHLAGTGQLLLAFLVAISVTLIIGSVRSVKIYSEKKGRGIIWLTTFIIISFILALCCLTLQLPGAEPLLYFSIISIAILFPALSVYFYSSSKKLKDYLLIRLIQDNQSIIEGSALTLIGFGLIFNYSALLLGQMNYGGIIYFLFSIILIGMYVYSLTWKYYIESDSTGNRYTLLLLITSSVAFIMFLMPVIRIDYGLVLRSSLAFVPMIILCLITAVNYYKFSNSKNKSTLTILSVLLLFYPLLRLGTKLQWYSDIVATLITNNYFILGFLLVLIVLLIAFRKERLFKALIILTMASHMIPSL